MELSDKYIDGLKFTGSTDRLAKNAFIEGG